MTSCSSPEENSLGTAACHSILLVRLFYCISCRVIHCSIFASCGWSGIIHHPNHWNWGPYGLGVNYEAMRKVIIFAQTAILCYNSLCHPSFLIWKKWKSKSHRTSFCSLDWCWRKKTQSMKIHLINPRLTGLFLVYFEFQMWFSVDLLMPCSYRFPIFKCIMNG